MVCIEILILFNLKKIRQIIDQGQQGPNNVMRKSVWNAEKFVKTTDF